MEEEIVSLVSRKMTTKWNVERGMSSMRIFVTCVTQGRKRKKGKLGRNWRTRGRNPAYMLGKQAEVLQREPKIT